MATKNIWGTMFSQQMAIIDKVESALSTMAQNPFKAGLIARRQGAEINAEGRDVKKECEASLTFRQGRGWIRAKVCLKPGENPVWKILSRESRDDGWVRLHVFLTTAEMLMVMNDMVE